MGSEIDTFSVLFEELVSRVSPLLPLSFAAV
jgi:hypothetical protein